MEYVLKMQLDGGREREGRLRMYLVAKKSIQKQYVDLCTRLQELRMVWFFIIALPLPLTLQRSNGITPKERQQKKIRFSIRANRRREWRSLNLYIFDLCIWVWVVIVAMPRLHLDFHCVCVCERLLWDKSGSNALGTHTKPIELNQHRFVLPSFFFSRCALIYEYTKLHGNGSNHIH